MAKALAYHHNRKSVEMSAQSESFKAAAAPNRVKQHTVSSSVYPLHQNLELLNMKNASS